ncbi:MAG TPA: hypothetical protein VJ728_04635, partial [Candidatus Binataceae bacterium]|nr:hypothetical protein [Candidatus Binataceae bacterium]
AARYRQERCCLEHRAFANADSSKADSYTNASTTGTFRYAYAASCKAPAPEPHTEAHASFATAKAEISANSGNGPSYAGGDTERWAGDAEAARKING